MKTIFLMNQIQKRGTMTMILNFHPFPSHYMTGTGLTSKLSAKKERFQILCSCPTANLEKTKDFYVDVLGFEIMPRPDFPFKGYWLGVNGKIQVHMGQAGIANAELYYLGTTKASAQDNAGVIDHIAFLATGPRGEPTIRYLAAPLPADFPQ